MPQSLVKNYVHTVFSTKDRRPFLKPESLRQNLHGYLAGGCRNLDSPSIQVGGTEYHIHIACMLSKNTSMAAIVRDLKRESSKWVKQQSAQLAAFGWQRGYGAFSISPAHVRTLKQYIANQQEHHRRETFQDEFRRLLTKYGIEYDERYVWD